MGGAGGAVGVAAGLRCVGAGVTTGMAVVVGGGVTGAGVAAGFVIGVELVAGVVFAAVSGGPNWMVFKNARKAGFCAVTTASSPESLKNQVPSGRWRMAV